MFIASDMSAASFHSFADISVVSVNSILLSALVGFLTSLRNSAAAVLSGALSRPIVVVWIRLLTVCYMCISMFNALTVTIVAMVSRGCVWRGFILPGKGRRVRLGRVA